MVVRHRCCTRSRLLSCRLRVRERRCPTRVPLLEENEQAHANTCECRLVYHVLLWNMWSSRFLRDRFIFVGRVSRMRGRLYVLSYFLVGQIFGYRSLHFLCCAHIPPYYIREGQARPRTVYPWSVVHANRHCCLRMGIFHYRPSGLPSYPKCQLTRYEYV